MTFVCLAFPSYLLFHCVQHLGSTMFSFNFQINKFAFNTRVSDNSLCMNRGYLPIQNYLHRSYGEFSVTYYTTVLMPASCSSLLCFSAQVKHSLDDVILTAVKLLLVK